MIGYSGNVRVNFTHFAFLPSDTEPHADGALIPEVRRAASRPLRLHVAHAACHAVIPAIYKEGDSDVDDLRYEGILLLVRRVRFDLREYERVPVLDDGLGKARDYSIIQYSWGCTEDFATHNPSEAVRAPGSRPRLCRVHGLDALLPRCGAPTHQA